MILHVTDFHCNERWLRWLSHVSRQYSLICITGDLLDLNPYLPQDPQVDRVIPFLRSLRSPLAVVSGNHDCAAGEGPRLEHAQWLKEVREERVWIDEDSFKFGAFRFRCLPWQGQLPIAGPKEVWLHHAPPGGANTAIAKVGCDFGDFNLGEHLRAGLGPNLVLSGHVHDPVRKSDQVLGSWSLNPGVAEKAIVPNYFEIDLGQGRAVFRHGGGRVDLIRLWQPLKTMENSCQ
jgi:predicted phosphodiesterase